MGGLEFPDDDESDYLDFAYFAFVIGMTSQVSDVAVSSKETRRLTLAHGLLSFFLNAIIVALTINTIFITPANTTSFTSITRLPTSGK